jgi:hypothetical protein
MSSQGATATLIRWLLLVPAVLFTFYFWLATAIGSYLIAEQFCPEELFISDSCYASYMIQLKEALLLVFPAIAAGCMVLVAARIAPSFKIRAALATFIVGSVFALYQAFSAGYWATLVLTEIVALIALIRIHRKHRQKT